MAERVSRAIAGALRREGGISRRQRCDRVFAALWQERQGGGFDAHWRELSEHFFPRRSRFWSGDRNRGDKRNQSIIDSTGRFAARTLQHGLHAGLTSPARPWMKLTTPDPDLAEFAPVKQWLHVVTQRMFTVFAQTNLYNALPIVYGDMGVFGTAAMSVVRDEADLFRCYAYPVGSFALGLGARGTVVSFVREYDMTVRQVVEQFGVVSGSTAIDWAPISDLVKTAWDRGNYETPVTVVWLVFPNEDADAERLGSRYLPFASVHYERDTRDASGATFLRQSGFETFPVMVPRWDVTDNDAYGTDCPGMTALGDTKQLQVMQRRKGQLLAKAVDPPLRGAPELRTQKTSLLPGDITYVNFREGAPGLAPIHEVRLEGYQHLVEDLRDVRFRIQRAFFEDLFLMLAASDAQRGAQPMTAREVSERHEEKLLALGPVLERTNDELLDPLIDRVYLLMEQAGLIPEPPGDLEGLRLRVEYISIMAQAQKLVGVAGQDRFLQSAVALAQTFPEVRHKVNADQVVEDYADMLGIDPRIIRSTEEAEARAQAEAEAQRGLAAAQQAKDLAGAMAAAGKAPVARDSPLDRLSSAMGG